MEQLYLAFQEEWAIRALIASSLVGVMCGTIGTFMVLRNMSMVGDALSHAILPGIFLAFVVIGYSSTAFFIGTLLAALFSSVAFTWIQEHIKTKNDAAIGIVFTCMFSLGVIGISYLNNQQGVHLDLRDFLFGTILGVSNEDIIITAMITVFCLISIVVFYRYLFITTFQPTIAATMGISVKGMHYFLMLLLSFAIVASLKTAGVILVVAMLITPSATALLLTDKLKYVIALSGLIGLVSAVLGLLIAILANTTPGPAMCVIATIIYFLAVLFSPKSGLVFKAKRKRELRIQIEREDIIKYLFKNKTIQVTDLGSVAQRLEIPDRRISRHLQSLARQDKIFVKDGVYTLTSEGSDTALDLIRAHRLWETFLVDKVGLKDHEIHADAEKYEHLLSPEILDQLDAKLGFPTNDPHGSPIPTKEPRPQRPLVKELVGSKVIISKSQVSEAVEGDLWELGLTPLTAVTLREIKDGVVVIASEDKQLSISPKLASRINIESL